MLETKTRCPSLGQLEAGLPRITQPVSQFTANTRRLPGRRSASRTRLPMRISSLPAWRTTCPMWVNTPKRGRLGRAVVYSGGSATPFSNWSRLWVSTCSLSQAALAPSLRCAPAFG